ncbi:hypothetical protein [Frankia sp. QA3]|uniref:hypothetical protein n=1 Tax=Frankia sp. QA3 TaxID=710111 RepID=UPI000269CB0A|nr:hypothetical protein [Frankia sp. QA3]EIV93292.1 hypothetical protein FraQA3DRAFT_2980 [Frankia sp. QA3]
MDTRRRLDRIQIKVTLSGSRAAAARRALTLSTASGARHRVFFCVDPVATTEYGGIAPFDDGIILRLRQYDDSGAGRSDSTVKLRPARRSRLSPEWLGTHGDGVETFRLEADWAGERRVLAASLTAELGYRQVSDVLAGRVPLRAMFSPAQARFLRECGDRPVELDRLRVLGPIDAVRWHPRLPVAGFAVTAEQWTLDESELLELSIRVEPDGAEIAQIAFEAALHALGLDAEAEPGTKTHRALARLLEKS